MSFTARGSSSHYSHRSGGSRQSFGSGQRVRGFSGRSFGQRDGFQQRSSGFGGNSCGGFSHSNGFGRRMGGPRPQYIDPTRYINRIADQQPFEQEGTQLKKSAYIPTHSFQDFGLDEQLLQNVIRHGYTSPTPIQDQAIPVMMQGRDVVGIADTGTGKTAAFLLPLLQKIAKDPNEGALIVVPTRELASQIADEFNAFSRNISVSMCLCVGGVNIRPQIDRLRRNPHIVIGTPGRLKDLLDRKTLDTTKYANIVLDEVDRMLDIGFLKDIRYLISFLPQPRHSYFFSATITKDVETVMQSFLKDPITVQVKSQEIKQRISQDIVRVPVGKNKIDVLCEILAKPNCSRAIVFGRTKHGINKLEDQLLQRGLRVCAIHGNKNQNARQRALDMFKRGHAQALLATDVAARGIDIDDVSHVINFDEPNSFEDYTHRIGRTGRAGKLGTALTFVM